MTAFACLTVSVGLSVSADIVPAVTLTPEQTLALYGTSLPAVYRSGDTWRECTFEFHSFGLWDSDNQMPVTDWDFRGAQPSGFASWSDYISYTRTVPRLYYVCSYSDAPYSSPTEDQIKFQISPTLDISGILYYRQNFMMGKYSSANRINNTFCNTAVSYSASPVTSYGKGWDNYAAGYIQSFYVGSGSQSNLNTGFRYSLIDVYLENVVDGEQQEFSVSGQSLSYSRCGTAIIPNGAQDEVYYVLSIQCPTVSDGYIVPQPPETTPDYSGQLDSISGGISANGTLLQQILAKLDLIYQRMQSNGLPNPSLTPAQTMPRDLQQYYTGVATGAPSVSAVNGAIGGASDFIPFSSVLSSSGLGSLLGVLAGLCCAGWVLTRGRTG